jgi:hypothetical protein
MTLRLFEAAIVLDARSMKMAIVARYAICVILDWLSARLAGRPQIAGIVIAQGRLPWVEAPNPQLALQLQLAFVGGKADHGSHRFHESFGVGAHMLVTFFDGRLHCLISGWCYGL